MDIHNTITELKSIARHPHKINWRHEDPYAIDAIKGSLYKEFWRGTLTEYSKSNPGDIPKLAKDAIDRLSKMSSTVMWPDDPWPERKFYMGLGTYGWKYDLHIPTVAITYGIRFIDTAETYGYGRVESELGKFLWDKKSKPRITVATKVARSHMSPSSIYNAIERSLLRLGLDYIDLYQIHWPSPTVLVRSSVEALSSALNAGKILRVGVCNHSIDMLTEIQSILSESGYHISAVQLRYNLVDRGAERAAIPFCEAHNIPVIAYSPLSQGFNIIKAHPGYEVLKDIARRYKATEAQVALSWVTACGNTIPIPRTNKQQHAKEIAEAESLVLTPDEVAEIDEAYPITE